MQQTKQNMNSSKTARNSNLYKQNKNWKNFRFIYKTEKNMKQKNAKTEVKIKRKKKLNPLKKGGNQTKTQGV